MIYLRLQVKNALEKSVPRHWVHAYHPQPCYISSQAHYRSDCSRCAKRPHRISAAGSTTRRGERRGGERSELWLAVGPVQTAMYLLTPWASKQKSHVYRTGPRQWLKRKWRKVWTVGVAVEQSHRYHVRVCVCVCTYASTCLRPYYACMYVCMYVMCLCVCMCVNMYVRVYVCMCVNMYVRIGMYGEHTSPSPSHYAIDPFWRRSRQKCLQFSRHKADDTKTMQCATHSTGVFLAVACVWLHTFTWPQFSVIPVCNTDHTSQGDIGVIGGTLLQFCCAVPRHKTSCHTASSGTVLYRWFKTVVCLHHKARPLQGTGSGWEERAKNAKDRGHYVGNLYRWNLKKQLILLHSSSWIKQITRIRFGGP